MLKITIHPCFFGATQFTIQSVICLIGLDKSLLSTTLECHSKQFHTISLTILARSNLPSTPVNPVCWPSTSHSAFSQGCHNTFTCGKTVGGRQCPQTVINGDSEWRTGIYQWRLRMAHRNLPDSATMPWMCRQERVFWNIILNLKRPRNIPKQLTLFCMRIKSNRILWNYCSKRVQLGYQGYLTQAVSWQFLLIFVSVGYINSDAFTHMSSGSLHLYWYN